MRKKMMTADGNTTAAHVQSFYHFAINCKPVTLHIKVSGHP